MKVLKKILKVFAIIAAIAGAAAAIYFAIQKLTGGKSAAAEDDFENYVSCSCCDDDFISETVAERYLETQRSCFAAFGRNSSFLFFSEGKQKSAAHFL